MLDTLNSYIWSEWFWLGNNVTWDVFYVRKTNAYYPILPDFKYSIFTAVLLTVLRIFLEQFIWKPLGRTLGLKEKKVPSNPKFALLETNFKNGDTDVQVLSKKYDMSERQVKHYMNFHRRLNQPSKLVKFSESGWRFTFYLCLFYYGLWFQWDKPWIWDTNYCWIGHPYLDVAPSMFWYYMTEYGYYLSSAVFIFTDVKRKDFKEMLLHHVVTLILMTFSWICNFVRIGSVILVLHDAADYWMEFAKMANYVNRDSVADGCFIVFFIVWICTRLVYFPFWCIYSATFESGIHKAAGICRYFFSALLIILQFLHIIWTYFIIKVIYRGYIKGRKQDSRSDSEESNDDANFHSPEPIEHVDSS